MKIFKVFAVLVLVYLGYKGFVAFKNFETGASNQVAKIEEVAGIKKNPHQNFETGESNQVAKIEEVARIEKEGEVIALLMYLGQPRTLAEHYYTENKKYCLKLRKKAQENTNAYFECAKVDAILTGKKIVSIVKKLEVIK